MPASQGRNWTAAEPPRAITRTDPSGIAVSVEARRIADWVMATDDNQHMPFMVVDKANARMFLFAAGGTLVGTTPVLLGLGRGDDSPAGIGDRPLASIPPADRITPAGRFEATMGVNLAGQDILWVDYDAALSVHRASDPKPGLTTQGRLARLASLTVEDNRVSHGCINVPAAFFEQVLRPAFADTIGIVYILPETRPLRDLFPQVS
ncbi:MAG: L,D-transpeptidase [Allosphingosinicella sp.]